jgi:hypothetical protein
MHVIIRLAYSWNIPSARIHQALGTVFFVHLHVLRVSEVVLRKPTF